MRLCNRAAGNLKIHEEKLYLLLEQHPELGVRAHNDSSDYRVNNDASIFQI